MALIWFILIGLVAGWLAGMLVKGAGFAWIYSGRHNRGNNPHIYSQACSQVVPAKKMIIASYNY